MDPYAAPRRQQPWGLIVALAVLVVLAVVVAAVTTVLGVLGARPAPRSGPLAQVTYTGDPGVAGQELLGSMRVKPAPGWRVTLDSVLPNADEPRVTDYVGRIENRAYFVVDDWHAPQGAPGNWVIAVDVTTGALPYPPIALAGNGRTRCFLNGPSRLLCLESVATDDETMLFDGYVLDTDGGTVLTSGPTDLNPFVADGSYKVEQIGDYAVATQKNTGAHGIGDTGEFTWTVPGDYVDALDGSRFPGDPPANVGVISDGDTNRAFSASDGTVLLESAATMRPFIGGFVADSKRGSYDFYDEQGTKIGHFERPRGITTVLSTSGQLPWLTVDLEQSMLFDDHGIPMALLDADSLIRSRVVGDYLFTTPVGGAGNQPQDTVWDRYDLKTGEKTSCHGLPLELTDYVGSDGRVVLGTFRGIGSERLVAVDTGTCREVWTIDEALDTWMIGSTLVQSSANGSEIIELAPS